VGSEVAGSVTLATGTLFSAPDMYFGDVSLLQGTMYGSFCLLCFPLYFSCVISTSSSSFFFPMAVEFSFYFPF
jgi:hypothetical protein